VLRGSRGDAAGTESGSSFIERIIVNTGTVLVSPVFRASSLGASAGRIDRRSVQDAAEPPQYFEPGKPRYMGKGDSGYREGKDTSVPFDPGNCQFLPVLEWNCQRRNGNDNSSCRFSKLMTEADSSTCGFAEFSSRWRTRFSHLCGES
jgi:hypothetical protein